EAPSFFDARVFGFQLWRFPWRLMVGPMDPAVPGLFSTFFDMNGASLTGMAQRKASVEGIDFSRPFMPEELTPLFHTPAYLWLNPSQRLRYNQLHALYFNEQTMFFEKALARNVLGYFLAQPLPTGLKSGLRQFLTEEGQHTEMFRALNRQCAPAIYARQDF